MNGDFTALFQRAQAGDRSAIGELMPAIYDELHRMAVYQLSKERSDHTLQPTALINEAYLRLFGEQLPDARDRGHFLGIASRVMRQVLVDYARTRASLKRSAGILVELDDRHAAPAGTPLHFLLIEDALRRLEASDPSLVRLVEMRYFGGLTAPEIAELEGDSVHVVRHNLRYAQARLRQELAGG